MIDRGGDEGAGRRERVAIRARARAEPPRRRRCWTQVKWNEWPHGVLWTGHCGVSAKHS